MTASEPLYSQTIQPVSAFSGNGKYRIQASAFPCGKDLALIITGGTHPHIGACALAVYEPDRNSATVSNLTVYTHRDDILAVKCAKLSSIRIRGTVSASVGIHIENASAQELELLQNNCLQAVEQVLAKL